MLLQLWGEAYISTDISTYLYRLDATLSQTLLTSTSHFITEGSLPSASTYPFFYITIYASIAALSAFTQILASAIRYLAGTIASRRLFEGALWSVVRARVRWFDVTPHGKIFLLRPGLNEIDALVFHRENSEQAGQGYRGYRRDGTELGVLGLHLHLGVDSVHCNHNVRLLSSKSLSFSSAILWPIIID